MANAPNTTTYTLLHDATLLNLEVQKTEVTHCGENTHVTLTLREVPEDEDDEGILSSCAMGLIFAFGALSFEDGRPRGYSGMDFEDDDQWSIPDMLDHLRYESGVLRFYADYVRGRLMKTGVEIYPDGKIVLETTCRGEVATRWVAKLQGKKVLSVVDAGQADDGAGQPS